MQFLEIVFERRKSQLLFSKILTHLGEVSSTFDSEIEFRVARAKPSCQTTRLEDPAHLWTITSSVLKNDKVTKPYLLILFYFQAAKALDDFSEGIKVIFLWETGNETKEIDVSSAFQ